MMKIWLHARVTIVAAACCLASGMLAGLPGAAAAPAVAAASTGSLYTPLGPVRVLDTRSGIGGHTGPVGANQTITLQVAGVDGVPAMGATAVVLNVTATSPSASSFVTVFPDGSTRPVASNLNFTAGETIPNLVTVPVGTDGMVDFYNAVGTVNLIGDLAGYYSSSGSSFAAASPVRVLDTRTGTGGHSGPVGAGQSISLQVAGANGVPPGATAVVLNVTATSPSTSSFVTVYPDESTRPVASNLNFGAGETIPNLVVVPIGADGKVDLYNQAGTVNLIADLAGYYYNAGSSFTAAGPVRVLDTRTGTGGHSGPVGAGQSISLQLDGVAGVPSSGVSAVVLNVTATSPSTSSFVTAYPDTTTRPVASNLNFTAGETIPNLVVVPVGADGKIDLYNSVGTVNLIADLAGYYMAGGASWGDAIQIPGVAALTSGGISVNSVSCPSAGNCTAGGQYADNTSGISPSQGFVADEVNGTWGKAIEVPGLGALNTGDAAFVSSVSCGSAGNCVAGGQYCLNPCGFPGNDHGFVADEVNGVWADAMEVPGLAALDTGDDAQVLSVSCVSAGNCTVGGYYDDSSTGRQAFVADEVNGVWGDAIEVPGTAALNTAQFGAEAEVISVSCVSPGNCGAGGFYADSSGQLQAFVADEVNGTWDDAIEVPGTAALNTGGIAEVSSVSCTSAGNCAAGGGYSLSVPSGTFPSETFVVSEVNGTWGDAIEVPGTATLSAGQQAFVTSVSCASAGNCAAGGYFDDSAGVRRAFVAGEANGTWDNAIQVPGAAGHTVVNSVSCTSAGNCVAGGGQVDPIDAPAFVINEVNGAWGEAMPIPGISEVAGVISSLSCPSADGCTAVGSGNIGPFVVSQN